MTPDSQFIIHRHLQHPRLHYAYGFSGHGPAGGLSLGELFQESRGGYGVDGSFRITAARTKRVV